MGRPAAPEPDLTEPRRRRKRSRPWWRSRRVRRRVRRALFWLGIVLIGFTVLCGISAIFVAPSLWRASRDGRVALEEGAAAVLRRDPDAAKVEFDAARDLFDGADSRLRSPLAWPLRIAPVASTHVGVGRSLSVIGRGISDAGAAAADTMKRLPGRVLAFEDGRVDLGSVREARDALRVAMRHLPGIERALSDMPDGWVGGPLAAPRARARDVLPSIVDGVRKAEAAVAGLPSILAEGGTKRYLVAFSNLSELRGSGGLFGYVTALEANDGDLDLHDLSGRPTEIFPDPGEVGLTYPDWFPEDFRTQSKIFQNINMTTDFPTVGSFVLRTAEARLPLDGVIAVDPIGIAAVLGLTGPIDVPAWPQPINADNVAKIAMHDVYVSITDNARREDFFKQLVRTTFGRLTSTTVRLEPSTIGTFDLIVRGGHFRMYSEHPDDQDVFDRLGVSGSVERAGEATDVLSVVSQNAGGNKADWFLRRDITYDVRLDPDSGTAATRLGVTLRNTAPSSGLPDYVIGSPLTGLAKGTNRQILMLVRPLTDALERVTIDGRDVGVATEREGTFRGHRSSVDVPARSRSQIDVSSRLAEAVGDGPQHVYRLHILRQAVARPDFAEVAIEVPKGWRAIGKTRFLGDLTQDVVLEVRLERTARGSFVEKIFIEPLRLARRLLGGLF